MIKKNKGAIQGEGKEGKSRDIEMENLMYHRENGLGFYLSLIVLNLFSFLSSSLALWPRP